MGAYLEKYEDEQLGLFALDVMKIYLLFTFIGWTIILAL
jgi:hypothetical protein